MLPHFLVAGAAIILALAPSGLAAQATRVADTLRGPAANPADVTSPDATIAALYDVISGAAGVQRDWSRFRSLFVPGARLIPVRTSSGGRAESVTWSVEDYITIAGNGLERTGFFEREIHRVTESFGSVMHAFSTYESRRTADLAEKPFTRGKNWIQLLRDGERWWVVTIYWDSERPDNPIKAKYLPNSRDQGPA